MQTAVDPNATVGVRAGCAGAPEPEPQIEPEPEPEIDMMAAAPNIILSAVLPIIFGWMLFLTQLVVVFMVKDSIATVLKIKGCNSAAELGSFLAKIDAEIEVRSHLPAVNMFEGASAAFLDAVTSLLKLQNFQKCKSILLSMFIYIEKDIESHKNIPNINLYYKTHQQHQIQFSKTQLVQNPYLKKWAIHLHQRFPLIFMARLWRT